MIWFSWGTGWGGGGRGAIASATLWTFFWNFASWCYAVNFLLELATRSWCYAVNFPLMPCWSERISSWSCMTSKKTMCTKHYSEDTSGSSLAGTQIIDRAWISLNNDWWPQHVNATFKKGQFSSCQKMSRPWCTKWVGCDKVLDRSMLLTFSNCWSAEQKTAAMLFRGIFFDL